MFEYDSDFILAYRKISCNIYDHERNDTEISDFMRLFAEFKKETPRSSYGGKADRKDNLIIIIKIDSFLKGDEIEELDLIKTAIERFTFLSIPCCVGDAG